MLHLISPHLAINYFLLAFITIVGALQFVAARHKLVGLSLVIGAKRRRFAYRGRGYLLAIVLVVGAFVWFFPATPEVFTPGLAGSELAFLFGLAGICAVAFTLFFSSILHRLQPPEESAPTVDRSLRREAVSWQQLRGTLYLPQDAASLTKDAAAPQDERRPAICALPAPFEGTPSLNSLVPALVEAGFVVLAVDWSPENEVRYPAMLGLLPSAVAYLTRRDDVDPERIGVLGVDLGGDLAIRSAATDPQIAAVLAVAPFLSQANARPGLSILKEMSYLEAIRWARPLGPHRGRGELVAKLDALDSMAKLDARPLLLIYGDQDGVIPADRALRQAQDVARAVGGEEMEQANLKSWPGERHLSLPRSPAVSALIARWFEENL